MPRKPRFDYAGARHHVMNRGARRESIFPDRASLLVFLAILSSLPERFGIAIHAYVLMPNHFHLLVESLRGYLSRGIGVLQKQYADYLNQRHNWDGPIFKARFHNRLVIDYAHWLHLPAYLHLNPVRKSLVETAEDWHWSSHGDYMGLRQAPRWLTTETLLEDFGSAAALADYISEVEAGRRDAPGNFERVLFQPVPREVPRQRGSAASQGTIPSGAALDQVSLVTGAPVADLLCARAGRPGHDARALAAWWLTVASGLKRVETGELLGVTAGAITQSLRRVDSLRGRSQVVGQQVAALEEMFRLESGVASAQAVPANSKSSMPGTEASGALS